MKKPEVYVSTDIESDGPIPGVYSMLSFGSAAFTTAGEMVDTYYATLFPLPNAKQYPQTMEWWLTQPDAWEECMKDRRRPEDVMPEYAAWLEALPGIPVFVGYPAGFDFPFIRHYLLEYAGKDSFGFSALDIKTYAMAVLGTDFHRTTKKHMPKWWFNDTRKHTHKALDDAIGQGELFRSILKEQA